MSSDDWRTGWLNSVDRLAKLWPGSVETDRKPEKGSKAYHNILHQPANSSNLLRNGSSLSHVAVYPPRMWG